MKGKNVDSKFTEDERGDFMPTIEMVESERFAYVKGMEEYLEKLKSMPDSAAVEKSKVNLKNSNIIQEDGEFTERYHYSREYARRKG